MVQNRTALAVSSSENTPAACENRERHHSESLGEPTVRASSTARRFSLWIVAATVVLAWLGLVIHNIVEFPLMAFTRAEYSVPSLAWLVLVLAWLRFPNHHLSARLLLGWGAISLA